MTPIASCCDYNYMLVHYFFSPKQLNGVFFSFGKMRHNSFDVKCWNVDNHTKKTPARERKIISATFSYRWCDGARSSRDDERVSIVGIQRAHCNNTFGEYSLQHPLCNRHTLHSPFYLVISNHNSWVYSI